MANAVGVVFAPYFIRKHAEANIEVSEKLIQLAKSNPQICEEIKYEHNGLSIILKGNESADLLKRSEIRQQYTNLKHQENFESIISQAANELLCETDISNEQVQDDWIRRYIGIIDEISDELMQSLWAKILAGELINPGTYSLRTLELLKNMSKEEAILFNKVASYALTAETKKHFILDPNKLMNIDKSIKYNDLITLIDLGLLSSAEAVYTAKINVDNPVRFLYGNHVIFIDNSAKQFNHVSFSIRPFTKMGSELLTLAETNVNFTYVSVIPSLLNLNQHITVKIAEITNIVNDEISWKDRRTVN